MLQTTILALIMGTWAVLYLVDAFLKSHATMSTPYIAFLGNTGLSLSIAQVRWYTTNLNRFFLRLGSCKPRFLRLWFTAGIVFGIVAMVCAVVILSLIVYNTLRPEPVKQQVLTPVMPGVNLPWNQMWYYLLTLLVCGILHEMGHAVAAVREQVRVNGFGIFVMALYPGAFVDLYTEHLMAISPIRQLRIYCAGVWHNFIIAVVAVFVLFTLPWLLLPFYHTGNAVVVTHVFENSAVSGSRGLAVGEHVTSISGCRVTSISDWTMCIEQSLRHTSPGFCMPLDAIREQDVSPSVYTTVMGNVECCANTTNTHLCFSYNTKASSVLKHACLPARSTTDRPVCRVPSDCYNPNMPSTCVMPSLDNSTKLLRVMHLGKPPLLFLGHPLDLHYAVVLSDYVPNSSWIPVNIPYIIETFSKYLVSLSGALALLNVVPCYALDGQFILLAFIEYAFPTVLPHKETRMLLYTVLLIFGTILLSTNIIIALWTLFR